MEQASIRMKCCICGRVKTQGGWEYQFRENEDESSFSHGFCTTCYEEEMKKIRLYAALPAVTG